MKLSSDQIKQIIPHREPFLLVDEVSSINIGCDITASLYLNPDWDIFKGHFPGNPVLPGAYLVEAMAQVCAVLLVASDDGEHKLPLLQSLEKIRFLRQGKPGDTITLTAELVSNAGNGLYDCKVSASSKDGRLATGSMTLVLR